MSTPPTRTPPQREPFLGLSATQVAGGALAATSSALLASFLGVAGTLLGAALGSVIATVGGAFYTRSLRRAKASIHQGVFARRDGRGANAPAGAARRPPTPSATDQSVSRDGVVTAGRPRTQRRRTRRHLALGGVAMFVLALGAITGIELALGHPISSASTSGTSISRAVQPAPNQAPAPAPSATHSGDTTPAPEPTHATEAPEPTATEAPTPTQEPTRPPEPTEAPEPTAPAPTGDAGHDGPQRHDGAGASSAPAPEPTG